MSHEPCAPCVTPIAGFCKPLSGYCIRVSVQDMLYHLLNARIVVYRQHLLRRAHFRIKTIIFCVQLEDKLGRMRWKIS